MLQILGHFQGQLSVRTVLTVRYLLSLPDPVATAGHGPDRGIPSASPVLGLGRVPQLLPPLSCPSRRSFLWLIPGIRLRHQHNVPPGPLLFFHDRLS